MVVRPGDPSHFYCRICGREYNYSQRIVHNGDVCVDCAKEAGVEVSELEEERIVNWRRDQVLEVCNAYYGSVKALTAKRGITGDIAPLTVDGPLINITIGSEPTPVVVEPTPEDNTDESETGKPRSTKSKNDEKSNT